MKAKLLKELYQIITPSKIDLFERLAPLRTRHITVVLENIFQEHNASAVLRSCESFGIQDLHLIEKNNKYKVQRDIARGAGRWVDMFNYASAINPEIECLTKLKKNGYKIIATSSHSNGYTLGDIPLDEPIAIVFGTENDGISDEIEQMADGFLKIPTYGFTESLNISVSAAIILNTLRQRLELSDIDFKLSNSEILDLKLKWCENIIPRGHLVVPEIERRLLQKD